MAKMTSMRNKLLLPGLLLLLLLFLPLVGQERGPKLILFLSVDQMRFDYLTRFAELYQGGLRTLLDKGAIFTNAECGYANTETGPGHSVMLSGLHPSHSGIIANAWYDPFLKKMVNVVDDPVIQPIDGKGRGASPSHFIGFTLGDYLKLHSPDSKVVGVSLKDRAAILMTGHHADAAYWYSREGGNFTTSSYYAKSLPEWLTNWNKLHRVDGFSGKTWNRLLMDQSLYEKYAGPDNVEGEWDRKDVIFPHSIRGNPPSPIFYDDFQRTPFADEVTLEVALLAKKAYQLGENASTDILAISFSATDLIGHSYGGGSQEIMDQLLRLDQLLKKLFEDVESSVGLDATCVVLTADHGALPLVEGLRAKGIDARRVPLHELKEKVQEGLEHTFPAASGLLLVLTPFQIYFDEEAILRNKLDWRQVEECVRKVLLETGIFEAIYTQSEILDPSTPKNATLELIRNSFYQPRSPHLTLIPKPYVYISDYIGGTGHGTPHDYDRHIPIIFMTDRVRAGRYEASSNLEDIAPTLAEMLGWRDYPRERDSRILKEMFR
jgi:predicted AlkP superfamily pyrophosphatase or phosphodiesterase